MARGVRKTTLEKLREELQTTQEAVSQYKNCLNTLREKEKTLQEQIEIEELKALSSLMKDQNLSVGALKDIIVQYQNDEEQSA
ncbi:MAG: hypothetical protein ACRDBO_08375 [Lachnospiraceae bacterium]